MSESRRHVVAQGLGGSQPGRVEQLGRPQTDRPGPDLGRPERRHRARLQPPDHVEAALHAALYPRLQLLHVGPPAADQRAHGRLGPAQEQEESAQRRRPAGRAGALQAAERLPEELSGHTARGRYKFDGRRRAELLHAAMGGVPVQQQGA